MNWSRYSFLEKLKMILSICKGHSTNIVNVAMHTQDINLSKKMFEVEEIRLKDIAIVDLIHHGIKKYEKYHLFFKVLMDKVNQLDNKDLVITPQIELILKGFYVDLYNFSNSGSITNDNDFIIQNSNPVQHISLRYLQCGSLQCLI